MSLCLKDSTIPFGRQCQWFFLSPVLPIFLDWNSKQEVPATLRQSLVEKLQSKTCLRRRSSSFPKKSCLESSLSCLSGKKLSRVRTPWSRSKVYFNQGMGSLTNGIRPKRLIVPVVWTTVALVRWVALRCGWLDVCAALTFRKYNTQYRITVKAPQNHPSKYAVSKDHRKAQMWCGFSEKRFRIVKYTIIQ